MKTKSECQEILRANDCYEYRPGRYTPSGTYYLSHGEYDRPNYRIIKRRGVDDYYIYATYYYYGGTFNAPENGDVTDNMIEDAAVMR